MSSFASAWASATTESAATATAIDLLRPARLSIVRTGITARDMTGITVDPMWCGTTLTAARGMPPRSMSEWAAGTVAWDMKRPTSSLPSRCIALRSCEKHLWYIGRPRRRPPPKSQPMPDCRQRGRHLIPGMLRRRCGPSIKPPILIRWTQRPRSDTPWPAENWAMPSKLSEPWNVRHSCPPMVLISCRCPPLRGPAAKC